MPRTPPAITSLLLLCFTGPAVARAEPARPAAAGAVARVGSAVGWSEVGEDSVSTLGAEIAVGFQLGRLILEAEYDALTMLQYAEADGGNRERGTLGRAGLTARLPFAQLAWPGSDDPSSVLRLFVDAGVGRQRGAWSGGQRFDRTDLVVGAGWLLDHRMRPRRAGLAFQTVGWHFGWQLVAARTDRADQVVFKPACKGCQPPMPGPSLDLGLIVSCALAVSW